MFFVSLITLLFLLFLFLLFTFGYFRLGGILLRSIDFCLGVHGGQAGRRAGRRRRADRDVKELRQIDTHIH